MFVLQLPPGQGGQLRGAVPAWAVTRSRFASADQPNPGGLPHGLLTVSYLLALQNQELNPILTLGHTCSTTGVT